MVTVEYRIATVDREPFLEALASLEHERKRDGAYAWGVFQDTADDGRYVETFFIESWLEHLRQHQRVTNADRVLERLVLQYVQRAPVITHLLGAEPERAADKTNTTMKHR
jgi:hypothetical protein